MLELFLQRGAGTALTGNEQERGKGSTTIVQHVGVGLQRRVFLRTIGPFSVYFRSLLLSKESHKLYRRSGSSDFEGGRRI